MKKVQKSVIYVVLFFSLVFVLSACYGGHRLTQLDVPENLHIIETTLIWDKIDNANGYSVEIDGEADDANTNSYSLENLTVQKTYQIKIKALGDGMNYSDSNWSEAIPYSFNISEPEFFVFSQGIITGLTAQGKEAPSISIPAEISGSAVTAVGQGAFSGNLNLLSIAIPASVQIISPDAFDGCENLASITVNAANLAYASQDGILYDRLKANIIVVPNSINCHVTLPGTILAVQSTWFSNKSLLKGITVSDSTLSISQGAFANCVSLEDITLPFIGNSLNSANNYLGCVFGAPTYEVQNNFIPKSLKNITITGGNTLASNAFYGCNFVRKIILSEKFSNIEKGIFTGCSGLEEIELPFLGMTLANTNNRFIGYNFNASNYQNNASYVPQSLKTVIIKNGDRIEYEAFNNCKYLTSVVLSENTESIGSGAFSGCTSLTALNLENCKKLKYISDTAFQDCASLSDIKIPASVLSIGTSAFSGCTSMTDITVDVNNTHYSSKDGILYNKNKTTLIKAPSKSISGSFSVPDNVTVLEQWAFYDCISLTEILIHEGVTEIGAYAFENTGIWENAAAGIVYADKWAVGYKNWTGTTLSLKNDTVGISGGAFARLPATRTTLPESVLYIGKQAFWRCENLASVELGSSVKSIGSNAFQGTKITSIYIPFSVTYMGSSVFYECSSALIVFVRGYTDKPDGWESGWDNRAYYSNAYWPVYTNWGRA